MWFLIAMLMILGLGLMLTGIAHGGLAYIPLVAAAVLLIYQLVKGRGPR